MSQANDRAPNFSYVDPAARLQAFIGNRVRVYKTDQHELFPVRTEATLRRPDNADPVGVRECLAILERPGPNGMISAAIAAVDASRWDFEGLPAATFEVGDTLGTPPQRFEFAGMIVHGDFSWGQRVRVKRCVHPHLFGRVGVLRAPPQDTSLTAVWEENGNNWSIDNGRDWEFEVLVRYDARNAAVKDLVALWGQRVVVKRAPLEHWLSRSIVVCEPYRTDHVAELRDGPHLVEIPHADAHLWGFDVLQGSDDGWRYCVEAPEPYHHWMGCRFRKLTRLNGCTAWAAENSGGSLVIEAADAKGWVFSSVPPPEEREQLQLDAELTAAEHAAGVDGRVPLRRAREVYDHEAFAADLDAAVKEIRDLLVQKNQAYGNSALDPVRIFSKASNMEQLFVRIDDKLSRLKRGSAAGEDVVKDLQGYLLLVRVAQMRAERETT